MQPRSPAHKPEIEQNRREYTLSEAAKAPIWAELARLTPALRPTAAGVLSFLTAEALKRGGLSVRASVADIVESTGFARSGVIVATSQLVALRLIAKRKGSATSSSAYLLRFAETLRMGSPKSGPPASVGGSPNFGPPDRENRPLFEVATGVQSIDSSTTESIDKACSIDRSSDVHFEACKNLMTAFARHVARIPTAHPPDRRMVSTMLNVAEWECVEAWLASLLRMPPPIVPPANVASPYAWLIAVAIQKIHGIAPADQKPTLELLRGGRQMRSKWAEQIEAQRRRDDELLEQQRVEYERLLAEEARRSAAAGGEL
jgi:hypothetical protein